MALKFMTHNFVQMQQAEVIRRCYEAEGGILDKLLTL